MKTSGRIPSTSSIYPLRVMAKGGADSITWHIVQANGNIGSGFTNVSDAFVIARMMIGLRSTL